MGPRNREVVKALLHQLECTLQNRLGADHEPRRQIVLTAVSALVLLLPLQPSPPSVLREELRRGVPSQQLLR